MMGSDLGVGNFMENKPNSCCILDLCSVRFLAFYAFFWKCMENRQKRSWKGIHEKPLSAICMHLGCGMWKGV